MDKNKILIELSESEKTDFGKVAFASQSIPQKVFSAVWAVEAEVNNGGFSQYFVNCSETESFVAEALDTIGAPQTAAICRKAVALGFPSGLPEDPAAIAEMAHDFSDEILDELGNLDAEFFAYPHNLTELLFAYVSRYPEEFGVLPKV